MEHFLFHFESENVFLIHSDDPKSDDSYRRYETPDLEVNNTQPPLPPPPHPHNEQWLLPWICPVCEAAAGESAQANATSLTVSSSQEEKKSSCFSVSSSKPFRYLSTRCLEFCECENWRTELNLDLILSVWETSTTGGCFPSSSSVFFFFFYISWIILCTNQNLFLHKMSKYETAPFGWITTSVLTKPLTSVRTDRKVKN